MNGNKVSNVYIKTHPKKMQGKCLNNACNNRLHMKPTWI